MFWHIDTDIVSLILMIVMYYAIIKYIPDESRVGKRFKRCVVFCILILIIDIAASIVMDVPSPRWLYYTLMTAYFAGLQLVMCTWTQYTAELIYEDYPEKAFKVNVLIITLFIFYVIYILANLWTGWIFSIDLNGQYNRGPLFASNYIIYATSAVFLVMFIVIKWKSVKTHYLRWILLLMPFILALGIYVQLVMAGWLTIIPSYALVLFIAFLFIQNDWSRRILVEKQEEIRQVSEAASIDEMTGLLNHNATFTRIEEYLEKFSEVMHHALFMIDLDNFKKVNDTFGHQTGDDVLIRAADRIKNCFRETDIVGRIGGDEFLVLMKNFGQMDTIHKKARELLEMLQFDCTEAGKTVVMTVSIGISLQFKDAKNIEQMYAETDAALYRAKKAGKNGYAVYTGEEISQINMESSTTVHLRTLLENMNGGIVLGNVSNGLEITYVSPSYYRYLVGDEDKIGRSPNDVLQHIYPSDLAGVIKACRRTAETGLVSECTYRVGSIGDRWRLLRVAILPIGIKENKVPIICVITDITKLKKSEMMLDGLIKNAATGVGIYEISEDIVLKPIYLNDKAVELNGFRDTKNDSLLREDSNIAVHPEDLPMIKQKINEAHKGASFDVTYRNNPQLCSVPRMIHARCTFIGRQNDHPMLFVTFIEADDLDLSKTS